MSNGVVIPAKAGIQFDLPFKADSYSTMDDQRYALLESASGLCRDDVRASGMKR